MLGHCCNALPHRQGKCFPVSVTLAKGSNLCTQANSRFKLVLQSIYIGAAPGSKGRTGGGHSFFAKHTRQTTEKESLLSLKVLGSKNEILEIKLNFNISLVACKISFVPLDDWGMGKPQIGDIPKNIERLKMVFTLPETVTLKSFVTELSCQPCTYNCTYYPNK